jgi:hypothetical protein
MDEPKVEVVGERLTRGQVLIAIPKHVAFTNGPLEVAEMYVPLLLATAKENGGTLTGTPEILAAPELAPRMYDAGPELRKLVEDHPQDVFILATMVPHDWTSFDRGDVGAVEHTGKTVRHPQDRTRRR